MKTLHLIAWIAGAIATILLLIGTITFIFKFQVIGIRHAVNYFHVADGYYLLAVVCILLKKALKE